MSDKMGEFIRRSSRESKKGQKHLKVFGTIDVFVKDPLPENVDIISVIEDVEEKVPHHLVGEVDALYVGNFKEFEEKQVNAMYRDGAIYVTNKQSNNADMIDDIIHEIAHAVEHIYAREIYADNQIQQEFLGKRRRLRDMIGQYGYLDDLQVPFEELEYSQELDNFLYKKLGYDKLEAFCAGLFLRPYAVTDVREYFATAFEDYLLKDRRYVLKLSPVAYYKITAICSDEV